MSGWEGIPEASWGTLHKILCRKPVASLQGWANMQPANSVYPNRKAIQISAIEHEM